MKKFVFVLLVSGILGSAYGQTGSIDFNQSLGGIVNGKNWNNAFYGSSTELSVAFGDLDGDGDLDLVQGSRYRLEWIRNTGTSSVFQLEDLNWGNIVMKNNKFWTPCLVDIDGDNDLDLFCGTIQGSISFWNNAGNQNSPDFSTETVNYSGILVSSYAHPAFCDLDNDGDYDLFIGDNGGVINYFKNIGNSQVPEFEKQAVPLLNTNSGQKVNPVFVDIDSDDDFDLIIGTGNAGIYFYENTGTTQTPAWSLITQNFAGIPSSYSNNKVTFADIDNDNDFDMFLTDFKGYFYFYENTGSVNDPAWRLVTSAFNKILNFGRCSGPAAGDIDSDGDNDVVFGDGTILRNDGSPANPEWYFNDQLNYNPDFLFDMSTLIDIDGDSDLDLFYCRNSGSIFYYENIGAPNFPNWSLRTTSYEGINYGSNTHVSVSFADIDADGDYDMFVQHCNWSNPNYQSGYDLISFYRNDGTRNNPDWSLVDENYLNVGAQHISFTRCSFGDIDNDSDFDCLCGNGHPGTFTLYLNNGTPNNVEWSCYGPINGGIGVEGGSSYSTPVLADLNNDSFPEILSGLDGGGLNIWVNQSGTEPEGLMEIVSPNGGEELNSQDDLEIRYKISRGSTGYIYCSFDNGFSWREISQFTHADAGEFSFIWQDIPGIASEFCLIKIQDKTNPEINDRSNAVFIITKGEDIPAAPSGLVETSRTNSSLQFTWTDNSTNEDGFGIYRMSDNVWTRISTTTVTSYNDNTLLPGKIYYYKVQAFNTSGSSDFSNTISFEMQGVPSPPSDLSLNIVSDTEIKIFWKDNSDNEDGFIIDRKTSISDWSQLCSVYPNSTTYRDKGLQTGLEYSYRIKAFNSFQESAYSNESSAITGRIPASPQNLQAQPEGLHSISLSWDDLSDNEDGFSVYRKDWNSANYKKVKDVTGNTTGYLDTDLLSGKLYLYKIYSFNNLGRSVSNTASATTGSIPDSPTDVSALLVENNQILLSWKANATNTSNYAILRKENSGDWGSLTNVDAGVTTVTFGSLATGSTYKFRIRAENGYGTSLWAESNSVQVTDPGFSAVFAVRDKDGLVSGAEMYIKKAGTTTFENTLQVTNSNGLCQLQGLKIGDEILARKEKESLAYATNKDAHSMVDDKTFVVYFDNGIMASNGEYTYCKLESRKNSYAVTLNHPVIGYNLIVSLDFTDFTEDFTSSFRNASKELYDASDGQAFLNKVFIYTGGTYKREADLIVENAYGSAIRPNAHVFGIYSKDTQRNDYRIQMGRSWSGDKPGEPDYDKTIIHEFGHYGFGFYDEYIPWDPFESDSWAYRSAHPGEFPANYGLMDKQYSYIEMSSHNDYNQQYPLIVLKSRISRQLGRRQNTCWQWLADDIYNNRTQKQVVLRGPAYDYFENGNNITGDRTGPNKVPLPYICNVVFSSSKDDIHEQSLSSFEPGNTVFLKSGNDIKFLGKATDLVRPVIMQLPEAGQVILHRNVGLNYNTGVFDIADLRNKEASGLKINDTKAPSPGIIVHGRLVETYPVIKIDFLFQFDKEMYYPPTVNYYFSDISGSLLLTAINSQKYLGSVEIDPNNENYDGTGHLEINFTDGTDNFTYINRFTIEGLVNDEDNLIYNYNLVLLLEGQIIEGKQALLINNTFGGPFNAGLQNLIPVSEIYSFDIEGLDGINSGTGLSLSYDSISVKDLDELSIGMYLWNGPDNVWEKLDSVYVSPLHNTVSSRIHKEGSYALFATSYSSDDVAPAAITDLEVVGKGNSRYEFTWTSPGDDGQEGQAVCYDIRYSDTQIDDSNWAKCARAQLMAPMPSGNIETLQVTIIDTLNSPFFGIRTIDEADNISALSNIVQSHNFAKQSSSAFALTVERENQVINAVFLGKDVNATNDFDDQLDRQSIALSSGVDLFSEIENSGRLSVDYRSLSDKSVVWEIKTRMLGPDLSYCTLTWDKTAIPMDGYYFIGDFNMRDTASLVFTADTIFRVRFISYDGQITSDINNPVTNEFLKNAYEKIRLYPNPTKDNVTVYFDEFLNYDWQLSIRTLNGKLLFLEEYRDRNQNKTIGVRNLPCGIYIFSISINNCVINKKLIIGL